MLLTWVYASEGVANRFSNEAKLGQYFFQGCINLAEFTLSELPSPRGSTLQARTSEVAPGCLSSTGITALALTKHFTAIGAHACDSCRLLKSVDLCNTNVEEIPEFTFVHCISLREVLLPPTLHAIRVVNWFDLTQLCCRVHALTSKLPTNLLLSSKSNLASKTRQKGSWAPAVGDRAGHPW